MKLFERLTKKIVTSASDAVQDEVESTELVDTIATKFISSASSEVKDEIRKTAIDLLPGIVGAVSMFIGIVIFRNVADPEDDEPTAPTITHTTITNNYFFNDPNEETIRRILEDR